MAEQRFKAGCEQCEFLGGYGKADLFYCRQGPPVDDPHGPLLLAKFSSEMHDGLSCLVKETTNNVFLAEAHRRAKERGLVS